MFYAFNIELFCLWFIRSVSKASIWLLWFFNLFMANLNWPLSGTILPVRCTSKLPLAVGTNFLLRTMVVWCCGRRSRCRRYRALDYTIVGILKFIRLELEYVIFAGDFRTEWWPVFLPHIRIHFTLFSVTRMHRQSSVVYGHSTFVCINRGRNSKFHFGQIQ